MSHITSQQLDHLAKLCRIQLTDADKALLLPQLEQIIAFVGQLDEVDVSDVLEIDTSGDQLGLVTREGVVNAGLSQEILANIQHPLTNNAVTITDKLSEY